MIEIENHQKIISYRLFDFLRLSSRMPKHYRFIYSKNNYVPFWMYIKLETKK